MKGTSPLPAVMLAIGLLAGSVVAVAAQEDMADPMAPGVVTGTVAQWRAVAPGVVSTESGLRVTDGVIHEHVWEASDPRLAGDVTYTGRWHWYAPPAGMQVEAATFELVNDAGRWLGQATAFAGEAFPGWDTIVFRGDGAYEGLTAYVVIDWSAGEGTFTGAIFPGDMPPFPATE